MLTVNLSPNEILRVEFAHGEYEISPAGYSEVFKRPFTKCYLSTGPVGTQPRDLKPLVRVEIKRYFADQGWSRERRRVGALTKALQQAGDSLTKSQHAMIWSAYHSRPRKGGGSPQTPPAAEAQLSLPIVKSNVIQASGRFLQMDHRVVNKLIAEAKIGIHGAH